MEVGEAEVLVEVAAGVVAEEVDFNLEDARGKFMGDRGHCACLRQARP